MASIKFDPTQGYATISGKVDNVPRAAYLQNGCYFDPMGDMIGDPPLQVARGKAPTPKARKAPPPPSMESRNNVRFATETLNLAQETFTAAPTAKNNIALAEAKKALELASNES